MHSMLSGVKSKVADSAVVEFCNFQVPVEIGPNSIVSDCWALTSDLPTNITHLRFPPHLMVHTTPVIIHEQSFHVPIVLGASDDVKAKSDHLSQMLWFGKSFQSVLLKFGWNSESVFSDSKFSFWNAKLFPLCSNKSQACALAVKMATVAMTNEEHDVTDLQHLELKELKRISLHEAFTLYKDATTVLRDRNTLYEAIQLSYLTKQIVLKASI